MKITSLATAVGIAVLIAATPVLAASVATPSPVKINAIAINMSDGQLTDFAPGLVAVAYTNMSPVAATKIIFDLENSDGKVIDQFQDVGTFPQGMQIHRNFPDHKLEYNQKLAIHAVTFADGTTWSRPSPAGGYASANMYP